MNAFRNKRVDINHIAAKLVDICIHATANLDQFTLTGILQYLIVGCPALLLYLR